MSAACPRRWELEASRDGRMSGAAARELSVHVASCRDCRAEQLALDALAGELGASAARAAPDELRLRRVRGLVLRRADQALTNPDPPPRRWTQIALGIFAAASVAGAVVWRVSLHERAPFYSVREDPRGVWSSVSDAGVARVALRDGAIELSVHRSEGDPRLVVELPDGTLEDEGTRFRVSVADDRTQSIRVTEGAVTFRRPHELPLRIEAGSSWTAPLEVAARETGAARPTPEPEGAKSSHVPPSPPIEPGPASSGAPFVAPSTVGPQSNAEREDRAYLEVLGLVREGREDEARAAANAYLRAFPHGFRRPEMERIAAKP